MKSDIVVFENSFNTVPLRNFTGQEMDLLFSVMAQMRDKGLTQIELSFEQLKKLSKYNRSNAIDEFSKDLERTYDKLIKLNVKIGNDRQWTKFVFFTQYTVDKEAQTIKISMNEKFAHLINELTGSFTKLELEEVTSLRSSYSKSLYKLLKQYRKTGVFHIAMDDFINLLDIPESYKIYNIRQRIFTAILRELPDYFKGLEIVEHKGKGIDRRNTVALTFTFEPEEAPPVAKIAEYDRFLDMVFNLYKSVDMDQKLFLDHQIEFVNSKNPKNFGGYLNKAIKEDLAQSIKRQKAMREFEELPSEEELDSLFQKRKK